MDVAHEVGYDRKDESHLKSRSAAHQYCLNFIMTKYGFRKRLVYGKNCCEVTDMLKLSTPYPDIETDVTYPYFEKDINKDTLEKLNYRFIEDFAR